MHFVGGAFASASPLIYRRLLEEIIKANFQKFIIFLGPGNATVTREFSGLGTPKGYIKGDACGGGKPILHHNFVGRCFQHRAQCSTHTLFTASHSVSCIMHVQFAKVQSGNSADPLYFDLLAAPFDFAGLPIKKVDIGIRVPNSGTVRFDLMNIGFRSPSARQASADDPFRSHGQC